MTARTGLAPRRFAISIYVRRITAGNDRGIPAACRHILKLNTDELAHIQSSFGGPARE
jgi:hypothetical protein